ncbi:MAG: C45 family autoproteolytic acyltransferase/hydrolase [Marinilabiliales bacterium]|nr:C45 family autoproteolytic acyltransferase/hydrolase [Marinilabiliales bacterium]
MRLISLFLLMLLSFSTLTGKGERWPQLSSDQNKRLEKAEKHARKGWLYLHLEGNARDMGFQHGFLMASEIRENLRLLKARWEYTTGMEWSWYVAKAGEMLAPGVDGENQMEMEGIVEGMKVAGENCSVNEIIGLNGYAELIGNWWPIVKDSVQSNYQEPPREACSSFIATGSMTKDGKIVLGHNTMDQYINPPANLVLDLLPAQGHRILMQSCAGFIHSMTDFFMTDAGLVGSETTLGWFHGFDAHGIPEFCRMRRATQDAGNIREWCEIMKRGNNGGYANAWLLGDIHTNEIARLELGLKFSSFECKKDGYFVGSNVVENNKILRFETHANETDIRNSSVARRVRWKELMRKYPGKIDLKKGMAFEADHYDVFLKRKKAGGRTLCGHWDLFDELSGPSAPYFPEGTIDGKVVDAGMVARMSFIARWGSACGKPFYADRFLKAHPQYEWMKGLLTDRPTMPWTLFTAGEK